MQALLRNHPVPPPDARPCTPAPPRAGAAIHSHLPALMPPLLTLASSHPDTSPAAAAAHQAVAAVAMAVQEDGLYLLMQELQRGLEVRRRGGVCFAPRKRCPSASPAAACTAARRRLRGCPPLLRSRCACRLLG